MITDSTNQLEVATPRYVLLEQDRRLGPVVEELDSAVEHSLIYGFSDKKPYDEFCRESQRSLTPYPLVKGYLRKQIEKSNSGLQLVVLDASDPTDPLLHATTMTAVLEAQELGASHVAVTHHLLMDQQTSAYRLHEFPG
jgi:hypothetical protein